MGFTVTSLDGYGLCASASDEMGTTTNDSSGTATSITVACGGYSAKVRYLTTPSSDTRFKNSIAIEIQWGNGAADQEVIVMVPQMTITSVVWKVGNTTFDENSDWVSVPTNATVSIKINGNSNSNSHATISNLSLYGYYVSTLGKGYLGYNQVIESLTTMGSWKDPGKARHRYTSANGGWTAQYYFKDFAFTPAANDAPNYYIMIAYKGWKQGIGHIAILEGGDTLLQDKNGYWDDGYGKYIRYSFYGIYDDGTSPGIKEDYAESERARKNQTTNGITWRNQAKKYAMWVQFAEPIALYDLTWYRWRSPSPAENDILVDSNKQQLKLKVAKGTAMRVPNVEGINYKLVYENHEIYDPAKEHFTGNWYQKTGTGSWGTTEKTKAQVSAITMGTLPLAFAGIVVANTYRINYNKHRENSTPISDNYTLTYGDKLTINPYGNLPNGSALHKNPVTGSSESYTASNPSYQVTITSDLNITDPEASNGYVFKGWTKSSDGKTLTANWEPNTVTITYDKNGGTGSMPAATPNYNSPYTIAANGFTAPAGKHFVKWNTAADGSGTNYVPGQSAKFTANTTLYAIWGSPWKEVKYIWIYEPDRTDQPDAGDHWYHYKPHVNTK